MSLKTSALLTTPEFTVFSPTVDLAELSTYLCGWGGGVDKALKCSPDSSDRKVAHSLLPAALCCKTR